MLKIQYDSHKILSKRIDIFLDETSDNKKVKNEKILNETFNTINEKIDIIINNNIKIFDNQLKMELNKKNFKMKTMKWN